MDDSTSLARRIGFPLLTCYGLGTILGAGIYVLVGKVAGESGLLAPLAFLSAALIAGVTALSYCQLGFLFPRAAGEAAYVDAGFAWPILTKVVGYMTVFAGIVSAATLTNGFLGYLTTFFTVPHWIGVIVVVGLLGTLALAGIAESLWVAGIITILEVLGLVLVVILVGENLQPMPSQFSSMFIPANFSAWVGLGAGAFLAFYAFIGFEDMVNIVEEVQDPARNMHRSILVALTLSTILYVLIALVAVSSMPLDQLAASEAPIRDLLQRDHPRFANAIAVISLLAIINGVLAQMIMGARMLYGMSIQERAPRIFGAVSRRTRIPHVATIIVSILITYFALALPLEQLAKLTSFVVLSVFTLINFALWRIKRSRLEDLKNMPDKVPSTPLIGGLLCLSLIVFQIFQML